MVKQHCFDKILTSPITEKKKMDFLIKHSYAFRESRWLNSGSNESSESIWICLIFIYLSCKSWNTALVHHHLYIFSFSLESPPLWWWAVICFWIRFVPHHKGPYSVYCPWSMEGRLLQLVFITETIHQWLKDI